MSSSSAGRRRSNIRQYSAEDQALNMISKEAEARLAAKRAARAEAREIRMKEMEKQHKNSEEKQDKIYELTNEHAAAKIRQQIGGSRRNSTDSTDSGADGRDMDFKAEVRELEDKYKAAMMASAQLDNEKQSLVYQVELLKDQLEEQDEGYTELQREYKDKCREYELQKRDLKNMEHELSILKQQLELKDRLIQDSGFVIMSNDSGEPVLEKQSSSISATVNENPLPSGDVLVSPETKEFLEKAGDGTLGTPIPSNLTTNPSVTFGHEIDVCNNLKQAPSPAATVSVHSEYEKCTVTVSDADNVTPGKGEVNVAGGEKTNASDFTDNIIVTNKRDSHDSDLPDTDMDMNKVEDFGEGDAVKKHDKSEKNIEVHEVDLYPQDLLSVNHNSLSADNRHVSSNDSDDGDEFYDAVSTPSLHGLSSIETCGNEGTSVDGAFTFDNDADSEKNLQDQMCVILSGVTSSDSQTDVNEKSVVAESSVDIEDVSQHALEGQLDAKLKSDVTPVEIDIENETENDNEASCDVLAVTSSEVQSGEKRKVEKTCNDTDTEREQETISTDIPKEGDAVLEHEVSFGSQSESVSDNQNEVYESGSEQWLEEESVEVNIPVVSDTVLDSKLESMSDVELNVSGEIAEKMGDSNIVHEVKNIEVSEGGENKGDEINDGEINETDKFDSKHRMEMEGMGNNNDENIACGLEKPSDNENNSIERIDNSQIGKSDIIDIKCKGEEENQSTEEEQKTDSSHLDTSEERSSEFVESCQGNESSQTFRDNDVDQTAEVVIAEENESSQAVKDDGLGQTAELVSEEEKESSHAMKDDGLGQTAELVSEEEKESSHAMKDDDVGQTAELVSEEENESSQAMKDDGLGQTAEVVIAEENESSQALTDDGVGQTAEIVSEEENESSQAMKDDGLGQTAELVSEEENESCQAMKDGGLGQTAEVVIAEENESSQAIKDDGVGQTAEVVSEEENESSQALENYDAGQRAEVVIAEENESSQAMKDDGIGQTAELVSEEENESSHAMKDDGVGETAELVSGEQNESCSQAVKDDVVGQTAEVVIEEENESYEAMKDDCVGQTAEVVIAEEKEISQAMKDDVVDHTAGIVSTEQQGLSELEHDNETKNQNVIPGTFDAEDDDSKAGILSQSVVGLSDDKQISTDDELRDQQSISVNEEICRENKGPEEAVTLRGISESSDAALLEDYDLDDIIEGLESDKDQGNDVDVTALKKDEPLSDVKEQSDHNGENIKSENVRPTESQEDIEFGACAAIDDVKDCEGSDNRGEAKEISQNPTKDKIVGKSESYSSLEPDDLEGTLDKKIKKKTKKKSKKFNLFKKVFH